MRLYLQLLLIITLMSLICLVFINRKESMDNKEKTTNISIIPLNIFQTWYTKKLPVKMSECVESIKKDNPEFKYR